MKKTIITVSDGVAVEKYSSLVELCREKELSYGYLSRQKLPFTYYGKDYLKRRKGIPCTPLEFKKVSLLIVLRDRELYKIIDGVESILKI